VMGAAMTDMQTNEGKKIRQTTELNRLSEPRRDKLVACDLRLEI